MWKLIDALVALASIIAGFYLGSPIQGLIVWLLVAQVLLLRGILAKLG
jgi:hypothetical protein